MVKKRVATSDHPILVLLSCYHSNYCECYLCLRQKNLLQWWRDVFRCRIDLLNFSMGFNIVAPYMEFLRLNWYIAECLPSQGQMEIILKCKMSLIVRGRWNWRRRRRRRRRRRKWSPRRRCETYPCTLSKQVSFLRIAITFQTSWIRLRVPGGSSMLFGHVCNFFYY